MLMNRLVPELLALISLCIALQACNPIYVLRAAFEESKILLRRQPIDSLANDPHTSDDLRKKLKLVHDVRSFAIRQNLTPGDSFTLYSELDTDTLVWVLMASRKDSFTLKKWWFPFVGSVPYKGYFSKKQAYCEASALEQQGFETKVRGSDAFSTLGWFNDPVLSTTLQRPPPEIVNTVLHEIFHSTVWIPNHVAFNESAANFYGHLMAINFFQTALAECTHSCSQEETEQLWEWLRISTTTRQNSLLLANILEAMYLELNALYESPLSLKEKLHKRGDIFETHYNTLQRQFPEITILQSINNAEIMQLRVYMTGFSTLEKAYQACHEQSDCFVTAIKQVAKSKTKNPFKKLREITQDVVLIENTHQGEM